ncbi:putative dehydrogenase [Kibdelosporangium banguiense]|uniref:Dehydrogenase n=1 Tax=Kibdelosporangium banguiense TaxID=1365924 RepID=A0ABS4TW93_9PSEU|nr:Gfo/Idh/MocA family oxidoreductase [Kibdelosporangium banguiense]MBP2328681.1 putative dehydrogenase [Kibdelosporangium banguiense]
MSRVLRVGVIGAGVGVRTYLPAFAATGRAAVTAIAASSPRRAREVAAEHGIPFPCNDFVQLCAMPELDLVCVASPNNLHLEHFRSALASGKHVLIEKPVAVDMDTFVEFIEPGQAEGQWVLVNHQLRFNPYLRALRDVIVSGALGNPYSIRIHQQDSGLFSSAAPFSWNTDPRGGGVRLAMGSHLVDLLGYLLGHQRFDAVSTTTTAVVPARFDRDGRLRTAADVAFAALVRANGTSALLSASSAAAGRTAFEVEVLADRGEARFDLDRKLSVACRGDPMTPCEPPGVTQTERGNKQSIFRTSFVGFAQALVEAILDGDGAALASACSLTEQGPTMAVLDAMHTSARTGHTVVPGPATVPDRI